MAKERNYEMHDGKTGSALAVQVITRCSQNELTGIQDDGTVRLRLKTPDNEEQADQLLVMFLSEILQVKPTNIEIVAGHNGKEKLVTILGVDPETLQQGILKKIKSV